MYMKPRFMKITVERKFLDYTYLQYCKVSQTHEVVWPHHCLKYLMKTVHNFIELLTVLIVNTGSFILSLFAYSRVVVNLPSLSF